MKPKLIQVCGLGFSGTTILDAALGCAPEIVGLGEALRLLDPTKEKPGPAAQHLYAGRGDEWVCSCGLPATKCPVWSHVTDDLAKGMKGIDPLASFEKLTRAAHEAHPKALYTLDSTPSGLGYTAQLQKTYDVRVIHLTRDVRSWSASRARRHGMPLWKGHLAWARNTSKVDTQLRSLDVPVFRLGYEEVALRPDLALPALCDWLEVPYTDKMLRPADHTQSHITMGNQAIRTPGRSSALRYDAGWLASYEASRVAGLIYPSLARRNQRLVYSNGWIGAKP